MTKTFTKHKHFELGTAIFAFVGIWSAPSKSFQEANPNAYNLAIANRPACCHYMCDHCGTAIVHHHMIRDTQGAEFSIGSDCIAKLNQYELTTASKEAEKARLRAVNQAKSKQKRLDQAAQREAKLDEQRKINNGLTDHEVKLAVIKEKQDKLVAKNRLIAAPIIKALKANGSDFAKSIARDISLYGQTPFGRGESIVIDMMTKLASQGANRNSKRYDLAYDEQMETFDRIKTRLKVANA
jgi:hypothetical protein